MAQATIKVSPQKLYPYEFFQLLGLDMYTPDELADPKRCVYGRNFRLYAPDSLTKRVAVTKRNGHTFYTVPIGETVDQSITSTTGAADQTITILNRVAQKFTAGATGNLTKIDVNIKNDNSGTSPLIVALYSDSSGPGTEIAKSSISNADMTSSYAYVSARFIEAPAVTSGTSYWVVLYQQPEGTGDYKWSSSTSATTANTSSDGGNTWSSASFEMNLKTYVSTSGGVKGVHRYYRSTSSPLTLFAHKSNVYKVTDATGATTSIKGSLSSSATVYDFATVNDKCYFVNGVDAPQVYDGTSVAAVGGSPPTSDNVEVHANHLFLLQPKTNYLVFSDAGAYETFGATSYIYIPSPKTADPVIKIVSSNGVLVCFTRNTKYLLYGTDITTFLVRESPSIKGAVGPTAVCKDEGAVYFVSDDYHVYMFNGTSDTRLNSERIAPILRNCADLSTIKLYVYDKKLFLSYKSAGQSASNHTLVYDLLYQEWLSDEDTYTDYGLNLNSQSDDNTSVRSSSLVGALYYGDQGTSDLGKPIDFDWWSKYMSFGSPAAKHRIKRYYTFLQGQTTPHTVDCQWDADEANSPTSNTVNVSEGGSTWGTGVWGTFVWGTTNFIRTRINVGGQAYKHQFRFVQSGADNKVSLLGFMAYVLPKRPK